MKPVHFSMHALDQMRLRGASHDEVQSAIETASWQPAKRNRQEVRQSFVFDDASPINGQVYAFKTIHAIFMDEPEKIVVITVLVYYGNEEFRP